MPLHAILDLCGITQKSKTEEIMTIIERPVYLNRLISKMDNGMIEVITGTRRCGNYVKSEIM